MKRLTLFVCASIALMAQPPQVVRNLSAPNDGSTGTVQYQLAKINGSGNAVRAATTDTGVPLYVCISGCGTTGSASLAVPGASFLCQTDAGGATIGHYLILSSTTNGRCHDAGTGAPSASWAAIALSTASANANVSIIILGTGTPGASGTNGTGYLATSTTSLAEATGSTSFTTQAGLAYTAGARARASSSANTANYMEGRVTSYSSTTLVINVDLVGGSGTHADWNINIAGDVGSAGTAGSTGATGATGNGTFTLLNDTSTGTTVNNLGKVDASGHAVIASTSDTAVPVFIVISGAGTTSSATLAVVGTATLQMDAGGAAIGHFIVASGTTGGRGHDAGATAPASGWIIGQATTTASANANATVALANGYNAASGANTGVCTITFSTGTATFPNASTGNGSGGPCNIYAGTLAANMTASSPSTNPAGMTAGVHYTVILSEDATGGRTVSGGPSNFPGFPSTNFPTTASTVTSYSCDWNGTACVNPSTVTTATYGVSIESAAPAGTPAPTIEFCWNDSTALFVRCKNSAGTIFQMAKELTSGSVRVAGGANAPDTPLSLTTTGSSGAASLSGGVLNIPQYSGGSTPWSDYQKQATGIAIANSSDTTVATSTMPANALAAGKCVKIDFSINHSIGSGNLTFKLWVGATSYTYEVSAAAGDWNFELVRWCNDPGSTSSQQLSFGNMLYGGNQLLQYGALVSTSAISTTSSVVLKITANSAGSGDQETLNYWHVYVIP